MVVKEKKRKSSRSDFGVGGSNSLEKALREERDRAQKYLDVAAVAMVVIGSDEKVGLVNRKGAEILGYPEAELVGENWFDHFVPARIREEVRGVFHELMAGLAEAMEYYENPVLTQSGEEKTIAWHNTVLKDEKGVIVGTLSSGEDITGRKRAEALLRVQSDLALALASTSSLDEGLSLCLNAALEVTGMDCGGVYIFDQESKGLDLILHRGFRTEAFVAEVSHYDKDTVNTKLILAGKSIFGEHLELGIPMDDTRRGEGLRAIAIVPIQHKIRFIGCFNVASHVLNEVPLSVRKALEAVVTQTGGVIARLRAEEALRESEEKYRIVHEFAGEAIFTFGTDFQLLEVNKAACDYVGMTREAMLGKNIFELNILHPEDINRASGNIQKLLLREETKAVDKLRFKGRTGLYSVFQVTGTPILRDGEIVAFTNVCRDSTLEERLYASLEASEKWHRMLFNAGNDAIYVFHLTAGNRPGKFIEANEIACQKYGYTRDELLKLSPENIAASQRLNQIPQVMKELLERRQFVFEFDHVHKDGHVFPVEISSNLFELDGVPTVLSIVRDITERKQAEDRLRAALKEKDVLLREIHHRVKNNMQIMSSLLRLQSRTMKDEKVLEAFNESQTRIRSMALIHESLYKSENLSSVDFRNYVEKMATHLFAVYNADPRQIHFHMEVQGGEIDINRAIPCGLIVNELISNALKHAFPQGRKGDLTVRILLDEVGKRHLLIKDNGIGFPEDFDLARSQTLGLQIIMDLTKQLEGRLELRRKGGTEFEIVF
jgi:PAS domain S-box-containing protein